MSNDHSKKTAGENSTEWHIASVGWAENIEPLRAIRSRVFIEEQGVSQADEWDGLDSEAQHFLVTDQKGDAIATARLLPSGQIGRMAVLAPYRRQGIGRALLAHILTSPAARRCERLHLHAQTHALGFYQQAGFVTEGPEFMDAGIPHRAMVYQAG